MPNIYKYNIPCELRVSNYYKRDIKAIEFL